MVIELCKTGDSQSVVRGKFLNKNLAIPRLKSVGTFVLGVMQKYFCFYSGKL